MIPYRGKKQQQVKGQSVRRTTSTMAQAKAKIKQNAELAEAMAGYALLRELKNVALVDISEYTQRRAEDPPQS